MTSSVAELTWILSLLKELEVKVTLPINLLSDNKSTMQIAANLVFHERTTHIELDRHFIRKKIQQGRINTQYIPIKDLTKGLTRAQHNYLTFKLGALNIFMPPNLRGSVKAANRDEKKQ